MSGVGELVLLAAPSCCGKTHFLESVLDGRLSSLLVTLGISSPVSSYLVETPKGKPGTLVKSDIQRMILHYTIPMIPLTEGRLQRIEDDPRLAIVSASTKVIAVTLVASRNVLLSRLQTRQRESYKIVFRSVPKYFSVRRKHRKLERIYGRSENVAAVYDSWFSYVAGLPNLGKAWLVTAEADYETFEPSEWSRIRSSYFPASDEPLQASS